MKILSLVMAMLLLSAVVGNCEQRYNANSGRWETVPDGSNWQSRYNPHENDWSYQPPDAQIEYNAHENSWDWDSGHNPGSED